MLLYVPSAQYILQNILYSVNMKTAFLEYGLFCDFLDQYYWKKTLGKDEKSMGSPQSETLNDFSDGGYEKRICHICCIGGL